MPVMNSEDICSMPEYITIRETSRKRPKERMCICEANEKIDVHAQGKNWHSHSDKDDEHMRNEDRKY